MSAIKDVGWLSGPELTGPAKRFAEFCKADLKHQAKTNPGFDFDIYNEATKLITGKLQASIPENDGKDDK